MIPSVRGRHTSALFRTPLLIAILGSLLISALVVNKLDPVIQTAEAASPNIVISQVYAGGGATTGAPTYKNDYVELFNRSTIDQVLTGWSLQYGSSTGQFASTTGNLYAFPSGTTIPAGKYLLVQVGAVGTTGADLPVTPDLTTGNLSMGAASGKVALANIATQLNCGATATPCTLPDSRIVDSVAWGASNNGEGGTTVKNGTGLTTTEGSVRKLAGCQDTDNNNADFDVVTNPVPRKSTSPINTCGAPTTPTITTSTVALSDFGNVAVGSTSPPKSYTVSGSGGLTAGITIAAPADFQISTTSGSGYTTTLTLPQSGGQVPATTIFVRFAPTSLGAKGGDITHESAGATTKNVAVSGTGVNGFTINGTVTNNTGAPLEGVQVTLASGETPIATTTTDASGNYSFTNVAAGNDYIVNPTGAGFTFSPASQTFNALGANQTANFTATPQVIISEFRFRGTGGATDEFVELYNQTDQSIGVTGWSLVSSGGTVLRTFTSGNLPARGHFLVAGTGYSLTPAGDTTLAAGTDIPDGAGIALFNNASNFVTGARLDAAGFSTANPLYVEQGGLAPSGGITANAEFSYLRKLTLGTPQDTDNNAADFVLVATDPATVGNSAILGAPGAENSQSPIQRNGQIKGSLVDPQCAGLGAGTSGCALVRDGSSVPNGQFGTLRIRRKFTNTSQTQNVTALRFRVVDITTLGTPNPSGNNADMRGLQSPVADYTVTLANGTTGVPIKGTQVETPPAQPLGGGLNSTFVTITPATPIAPGAAVNIEFTLGVERNGNFRFFINVEALVQAPASASEHLTMGNPSNATEDVNQPTNYLMIKNGYALAYHRDRGTPIWTSWHLDSSWLGSTGRQNDFRADTTLPAGWYQVQGSDYSGSGYDRGHMTPSGDRTISVPVNSETFLMTNMIPQLPANNQGPWADLEGYCRTLVGQGNELYIISGGTGNQGTVANGHVVVPSQTWKVIIVLPVGTNDASRVTTSTRTIAVILPNSGTINSDWRTYRVSVDQVEALTGFDFFSNVDPSVQAVIEAGVDNQLTAGQVLKAETAPAIKQRSYVFARQ
ncbi:MAG TPA: DNA/RNA non-specific endonuclease [Pyrinomonadaceae bacterium]|nr:DNA/RNA non-specific endonuclease [Pyrinomonadaceae bacterium]